jgi:hypothetical protein
MGAELNKAPVEAAPKLFRIVEYQNTEQISKSAETFSADAVVRNAHQMTHDTASFEFNDTGRMPNVIIEDRNGSVEGVFSVVGDHEFHIEEAE